MKSTLRLAALPILIVLLAVVLGGCSGLFAGSNDRNADEIVDFGLVSPRQAAALISEGADDPTFVLLDIRTEGEIEAGHIPGAVGLDYYSPTFRDDLDRFDRELTYLIYCRTGNRTGQAYRIMEDLGFDKVYDMDGGITDWTRLGYPVCRGPIGGEHTCIGTLPAEGETG